VIIKIYNQTQTNFLIIKIFALFGLKSEFEGMKLRLFGEKIWGCSN